MYGPWGRGQEGEESHQPPLGPSCFLFLLPSIMETSTSLFSDFIIA